MKKNIKQGFNAAAAAIGLSMIIACATTPPSGDDLSPSSGLRTLTPSDIDMAETVFAGAIDYSKVYIKTKDLPSRSKAYHSIIRFSEKDYVEDFSNASLDKRGIFIHELEHLRQEQSGTNLILAAASLFIRGLYSDNIAYNYGDVAAIESFEQLNIEQKASLTEHFYKKREKSQHLYSERFIDPNCGFQRDAARVLRDHIPNMQISASCDLAIA